MLSSKNRNMTINEISGKLQNETKDGSSKTFFYTGENSDYIKEPKKTNTSSHSNYQAFKKFQKQLDHEMVSCRPAVNSENNQSCDLNKNKDNVNKVETSKKVLGLVNRNDPSQVSFQEESAWLESLVAEEVIANKNKDLLQKLSTDFKIVGLPMLPAPTSSQKAPPVERTNYKYQRSKSEYVIEDNIVIDKRKSWLEDMLQNENKLVENIFLSKVNKNVANESNDSIDSSSNKKSESQHLQNESNLKYYSDLIKNQKDSCNSFEKPFNFSSTTKQRKSIDFSLGNSKKYNSTDSLDKFSLDKEVVTSAQSVKDVAKLFQTPLQTENNLIKRQNDAKMRKYARPKSYHAGVLNQYDLTSQDVLTRNSSHENKNDIYPPSSNVPFTDINLIKNKFGSANNIFSDAKNINAENSQSDFEANKRNMNNGMINMRVVEDIAETERREQEIREERLRRLEREKKDQKCGEPNKHGLAEFIKENVVEL
ncbi:uncharacterized protein LOC100206172 isoform X1 [Hydra vulgaris]|uniref:uncharacterized protein LOC100206172 isoform X1 n=1 Tax=Hydra vulgaris TaxID=6087 RepID=UPI001F5F361A|nr:uncharacterized protein LOC100206172 [Hydra vulgaris]